MTAGSLLLIGLRETLAVVLIAAGAAKLAALSDFSVTLAQLSGSSARGAAPPRVFRVASGLLASSELAIGLIGLTGVLARATDFAVLALTCGFVLVAVPAYRSHSGLRCRCFGSLTTSRFGPRSVALAFCLFAMAVLVVAIGPSEGPVWTGSPGAASVIGVLGILFAACCATASRVFDKMRLLAQPDAPGRS